MGEFFQVGQGFRVDIRTDDERQPAHRPTASRYRSPSCRATSATGGGATDGVTRILDRMPASLHDRVPLVIGNADLVEEATRLMAADPAF